MKIHPAVFPFFIPAAALAAACFLARARGHGYMVAFAALLVFSGYLLWFFRVPAARLEGGESAIYSPATGKVIAITGQKDPVTGEARKVVRIFLSIFDVHVQRAPLTGKVKEIRYQKGKFLDARDPQACFENEQNHIQIATPDGRSVTVSQIAGMIARRIVCEVKGGDPVEAGQPLGLICFGSQVDLFLPENTRLTCQVGDRVQVGRTVVGRWE